MVENPIKDQKVFITGNNDELGNWDPSKIQLDKVSDSLFTKTFSFREGTNLEFKFTGGSWWLEALDCNDQLFENIKLEVSNDTTVSTIICDWKNSFLNSTVVIDQKRFKPNREYLILDDLWKYHAGDNAEWGSENFNDSNWQVVNSTMYWLADKNEKWNGIGWFRFHFIADTSLWNKSLAILISQLGASQIYYNGKLLYNYGKIGDDKNNYEPSQVRFWKEFRIDPKSKQVIAVRYANYDWKEQIYKEFNPGFEIYLKDLNTVLSQSIKNIRGMSNRQMIFTLIPLILFFLHIFLYSFNPKQKENLYYGICLLGFAGITYFGYEKFIEIDPKLIILYFQLNGVSVTIAIFFGVMTFFSMSYIKIPKRWLIYFIIFLALAFMNFFFPLSGYSFINYIFFGMMVMEIVLSKFIKTERKNPKGGWIITVGLLVLSFFVVLQILIDYQIIQVSSNNNQVFVYGMVGFAISMSLFLSYNFAQINKSLEAQLIKVKELSEKTLEQERMANKLELERQKIEAENQRKTLELEAARKLQLSLLPKEIPHTKNYDIKFYMSTASEVGGDYYDILSDNKGQILIAVGDATGHGVSAGIIVSIVKGLLHQFRSDFNPSEILRKINDVLISMKISSVYMGLTLVKLDGSNAVYSSSGMPPVFHYHKNTNKVEDIIIKRMPLGATDKLEFEERNFELISGDKLFLFSDGLSELFNNKKEMFEFDRIKESLIKNSDKSSADLISEINKEAKKWRNGIEQLDDMTLAVINYLDAK